MSMRMVPPGSVIERAYYALPGDYSSGDEFEDFVEARNERFRRHAALVEEVAARYPGWENAEQIGVDAARAKCVVDLRWMIRYPDGGGTDCVAERINLFDFAERVRKGQVKV